MLRNWTNRDWFWLLSFLIGVIILLIAGFYNSDKVELNFSIISSAVSIALALVAIFIAIKQNGDNQVVTRETSNTLTKITGKIETMDNKIDRLDPNAVTEPAETQLIKEIGSIFNSKEEDTQKLEEITKTINEKFDNINNQLNKYYDVKSLRNYKVLIDIASNIKSADEFMSDFKKTYNISNLNYQFIEGILILTFHRNSLIKFETLQPLMEKYGYNVIDVGLNY